jgi:3-hydroxyisobutyrate dehydrogenase-like beta-hydroxyacid dehydrogenase
MAGYSGTPLAKKLGIKENHRVLLVNPPEGFATTLDGLPETATITTRAAKQHDIIILFAKDSRALEKAFAAAHNRLEQNGGLWVAWPKKTSGVKTDLTENMVRDMALAAGLVDNKVCAIDEVWSGLRLVVRLKDRK